MNKMHELIDLFTEMEKQGLAIPMMQCRCCGKTAWADGTMLFCPDCGATGLRSDGLMTPPFDGFGDSAGWKKLVEKSQAYSKTRGEEFAYRKAMGLMMTPSTRVLTAPIERGLMRLKYFNFFAQKHLQPKWNHDCDRCVFLGRFQSKLFSPVDDLYFCNQFGNEQTLIARHSNELPDYHSGTFLVRRNPAIAEAYRRALDLNLITSKTKELILTY